jgi:hypothetical protein
MFETTIFDDRGRHTYTAEGREVVQVYEGDGSQTFADQYKQPIWYTEVMFDILKRDGYNDHAGGWNLSTLRKAMLNGDRHDILWMIRCIREDVKAQFRDPTGDPRQSAMVAEMEWKIAFNEH